MSEAEVAGRPVSLKEAAAAAGALLGRSRRVAIGGLQADVAGVEASIRLARSLGASVDHAHAPAALRDLMVMRETGWIVTTPLQARARADLVLLVGARLREAWPDLLDWLRLPEPPRLAPGRGRTIVTLAPEPGGPDLLDQLGMLRARVAERAQVPAPERLIADARRLREARYGVAIWSADELATAEIAMLCGLIDDLNATTRFAGLPLPAAGNAVAAMQVAAWRTGLPLPLGFAGPAGEPVHDAWRFDAERQVARGEADAAVWISATCAAPPPWSERVPTVTLVASGTVFATPAAVTITVGRPGVDHDGVLFDPYLGALALRRAETPKALPTAGSVLELIGAAVRPC